MPLSKMSSSRVCWFWLCGHEVFIFRHHPKLRRLLSPHLSCDDILEGQEKNRTLVPLYKCMRTSGISPGWRDRIWVQELLSLLLIFLVALSKPLKMSVHWFPHI